MSRTRSHALTGVACAAIFALGASARHAQAQGITVVINDQRVAFTGAPPRQMNGAVLVPLRGVFEQMGATVNYDPATKTIQAKKGSNNVSLVLGSATAFVNGQAQTLIQPAAVFGGTTLVPLRFVAQSFGGYVQWIAASQTVQIKTPEQHLSTLPPPPASAVRQGQVAGALTGVYTDTVPPQITLRVNGRNTAIPITDATIVLIQSADQPAVQQRITDLKTDRQVRVTRNADGTAQIIQAVYGEVMGVIKTITPQPDGSSVIGLTDGTSVRLLRGAPVTMGGRRLSLSDVMTAETIVIRTDETNTTGLGVAVVTADDPNPTPPALPVVPPAAPTPMPRPGSIPLPTVQPGSFLSTPEATHSSEWNSLAREPSAKRPSGAGSVNIFTFRPEDDWRFANKRVIFNHLNLNHSNSNSGAFVPQVRLAALTASSAPVPGVTVGVTVQSFSTNITGPLRGREQIHIILRGTPGGKAIYAIPNLSDPAGLKETHPGVYEADYKTPNNVNVTNAAVVGQLTTHDGTMAPTIQAAQPVTIDNTPPIVALLNPPANAVVATLRPQVYALLGDGLGVGVDARSAKLLLDGLDVTGQATITKNYASYLPPTPLASGSHAVRLIVSDYLGNTAEKNWNFTVAMPSGNPPTFLSDHPGDHLDLTAAQLLGLTLRAAPGGKATYSLGRFLQRVPLAETAPGVYTALLKSPQGSSVENAPLVADVKSNDGAEIVLGLPQTITVHADAPRAPFIASPPDGVDIGKTLTVEGRSAPNTAINVIISYVSKTLGLFPVTGTAAQQQVVSNAKGEWRTIELPVTVASLMSRTQNTTLTISAVALDATGQPSDATVSKVTQE